MPTDRNEAKQSRLPVGDTRKPAAIKDRRRVTTGDLAALAMCAHRFDPADVRGWYTHDFDDVVREWIVQNVSSVLAGLSPHCEYRRGELPPLHPSDDLWVGPAETGPTQTTLVTDGGQTVDTVQTHRLGRQPLYVDTTGEAPPRLYRPVGYTNDPDRMDAHDGPILFEGDIVRVEDHTVYHGWMGRLDVLTDERLTTAATLCREVDRV